MSRKKRIEVPDLDGYEDEGIAVALLRLEPARIQRVLKRAAELGRQGFDPADVVAEHEDLDEHELEPRGRSRRPSSDVWERLGDAIAEELVDRLDGRRRRR